MCRSDTIRLPLLATFAACTLLSSLAAQPLESPLNWRAIGTTVVFNSRAGFSSGPVDALWFSADGASLEVRLRSGKLYRTLDFDSWSPLEQAGAHAALTPATVNRAPEPGLTAYSPPGNGYRAYAAGRFLWRSDDSGNTWQNLIAHGDTRLIGENIRNLALSPRDPDRIAVSTDEGLWFSADGGLSWLSLNAGLPNLRLTRLLAAPQAGRGLLAQWENGPLLEWVPGSRAAWQSLPNPAPTRSSLRWSDASSPLLLLEVRDSRLWRSLDGGLRWDDLTGDLPAQSLNGLAADRDTGALYLATDRGLFYSLNSFSAPSTPTPWIRLAGNFPRSAALDVLLNDGGNFLYVSLADEGVFLTHAPHRRRNPSLVSAADLQTRSAAPGAVLSVVGLKLDQAQLAGRSIPILSASDDESQLQIPYDAPLGAPALDLAGPGHNLRLDLDFAPTAPAIFTDRDGAPLLLDAATGELLEPSTPLRSGMRVQILLTGLGRVEPSWPAGLAAPDQNPPRVVAPVRVWLNGQTLEVSRAELASGYVGFYAVETKLPPVVDTGLAQLRVEAAGRYSQPILVRTSLD
jgi:uncharacterized protein (TIGR03437 family)